MPSNIPDILKTTWKTSSWAILPSLVVLLLSFSALQDFRWNSELFHVIIEGGGSLIGFGLAFIIIAMIQKGQLTRNYTWLIACFIVMGTLDLVHSQQHPGQSFVWLHTIATCIGGFFAALIWLPSSFSTSFFRARYFWGILLLSILASTVSVLWPQLTPPMLDEARQFTWQAKSLNILGSIGFMGAWLYFAREYHYKKHQQSFYFSNHFCLFAIAGFVFEISALWDANWWSWHIMRAFAYLLLMFHFGTTYRQSLLQSLKQSEDRYRNLVESSPDWIWEVNNKGEFIYCSTRITDILGYQPEEVLGKTPFSLMPADEAERLSSEFIRLAEQKLPISSLQNIQFHKNGNRVYLEANGLPILDNSGELTGYHGINRDITRQKLDEKEKARIQNELQQVQKMESLGHLTGGIAHDFNNLLGIISGYSELVYEKYKNNIDDSLAIYMQHINEATARASSLVTQMLTFSRSEHVERIPMQFAPVIREGINMLRATLPSTIEINTSISKDLPDAMMNSTQLHQVLMNLAVNARDAMNGAGKMDISLDLTDDLDVTSSISHRPVTGTWLRLTVSDTGNGIAPDVAKRIFDPFYTTKEVGKGSGMGLAVIYRIMEDYDGHILLDSTPGTGTRFQLLFPPLDYKSDEHTSNAETNSEILNGQGKEILIVDDEALLAEQIADLVSMHDYKGHAVTDSMQAYELFRQNPDRFSILITDQTMPGLSGTELIGKIRTIRPEMPVILCTGYSDKIDAAGAEELGVSYFNKPVPSNVLMHKISEMIKTSDQ